VKSDVSGYLELARAVYDDACAKCPAEVSDLRDVMTMTARIKDEGFSFLTITLPEFARDFERSLANGFVSASSFRRFRKWRSGGAIPAFLQGMLGNIFDRETGRLLDGDIDSTLIEAVRQFCLAFKKVKMPCTPARTRAAIDNFIKVEADFDVFSPSDSDRERFLQVSDLLWGGLAGRYDPTSLLPRHGPGGTAERVSGNRKYVWSTWYERLEHSFPFLGFGLPVRAYGEKEFEKVAFVPEQDEHPVRVITVPKTLKAPRVIALEPVCMQYAQQSLRDFLYRTIEEEPLSRGRVRFRDQSVNREMALDSSRTGEYATLDLSDASDRVPADLALQMFRLNPALQSAVDSCRSRYAKLPDGRVIGPLRKFASMGSALCFPVEAMYFYTVCVEALLGYKNLSPTWANINRVIDAGLAVYGDDLIVPVGSADAVFDSLQKYNCKVNTNKTFVTGRFRESCGMDAYNGDEVTPVYITTTIPEDRQQVQEIVSFVATANAFYQKGFWRTASLMFCTCERLIGPLPYVSADSPVLGRVSFLGYRTLNGWDDNTHRYLVKGYVVEPVYRSDRIDGYAALQKSLIMLEGRDPSVHETSDIPVSGFTIGSEATVDPQHLERSARRGHVELKSRWVPAL